MRANTLIILCVVLMLSGCQLFGDKKLSPFTTDGCSDFPEGTLGQRDLWHKCCTAHDLRYWAGGTYGQRLQADLELRACVQSVGEPAIAQLMLAGVRVGGSPWWPTRFRWGYGWPYGGGYSELTPAQLEQVRLQKEKQGLN
jgi:hypothetical protein